MQSCYRHQLQSLASSSDSSHAVFSGLNLLDRLAMFIKPVASRSGHKWQIMALTQDQAGNIANSLIDSEGLRLPARLSEGPAPAAEKTKYLHALLEHDPGVFLERHGKLISKEQRAFFEPLRDSSYEVDFYLKLLEDEDQMDQMEVRQMNDMQKVVDNLFSHLNAKCL